MTTHDTLAAEAGADHAHTHHAAVPAPEQRISLPELLPDFYRAMSALERSGKAGIEPQLAELVKIHASMINGCAFCIDMHAADAVKGGEQEHRIRSLPAWRETPWFTARERAALALTESVTLLTQGHVPDAVYQEAAGHFEQTELASLIAVIVTINAWNRIGVTSRLSPAPR
ncbi:AhpD family alkylhydroperoxidase [Kitasatospora herbaricolor]|uniref:carboxymuconolactone decarboxylase family protein n=1 Tax=Kitasatospora herbaricolor TaxID=68217 RepID=UPI0017481304|nr:carboxymuconolactone decarboxylase family protein [Kitasatospora herbaricolor]MDQ0309937.1 AhpD family alkylhydroperoxidase [Kitasatospora herbaricolor]